MVGASSCKPKGHRFNSRSGHIPRLQIWSPVRVRTKSNQSMFLSHINVSLLLSLPPFPSVLEGKKKSWWGLLQLSQPVVWIALTVLTIPQEDWRIWRGEQGEKQESTVAIYLHSIFIKTMDAGNTNASALREAPSWNQSHFD